ncbi:MAG: WYL domain-containing protein [Desulfosarcinaceae bacterium]|nr:WYL domain-containing protein [Desulfosarcinaceae bacterium]
MARGDQLGRQWHIIQTLIVARTGKTVADLSSDLDCHPRTVYRDLEALEAAGFPIYTERAGGKNYWYILDAAKQKIPVPFSQPELIALYFSRHLLQAGMDSVYTEALESLFLKVKTTLAPRYGAYLEQIEESLTVAPRPAKSTPAPDPLFEKISAAIVSKLKIEIDYFTMSRRHRGRRSVAPYKLLFSKETFYLIGYCDTRRAVRTFSLDRMENCTVTQVTFEPPDALALAALIEGSFGIYQGEPSRVKVRFSAAVAGYIEEKIWHNSQTTERQSDGSLMFTAQVAGLEEIKHWILRWGAEAEVLEPVRLRQALAHEAQRMVLRYSQED